MKKIITIISVSIFLLIFLFVFLSVKIFSVSGNSMDPTLKSGDKILVFTKAYILEKPKRGDLILLEAENKEWVKRIVGLPGELIEISDSKVKINNKPIFESYINSLHTYGNQRFFLDNDQYYVLGDNRQPNESIDSRILGPISKESIKGKVIGVYSPNFKLLKKQIYDFEK